MKQREDVAFQPRLREIASQREDVVLFRNACKMQIVCMIKY